MRVASKVMPLLVLIFFSTIANAQQTTDLPMADQPRIDSKVSKRVLLYRSLLLQDFDKITVEQIYGMHGQSWIKKKLKLGADANLFLSTGFSKHSKRLWRAPDPALIAAIGLVRVKSVNEAQDNDLIVVVENVDWASETLVKLDIGTFHRKLGNGIHGSVEVELEFKNAKWKIVSNGGCHMRKVKGDK